MVKRNETENNEASEENLDPVLLTPEEEIYTKKLFEQVEINKKAMKEMKSFMVDKNPVKPSSISNAIKKNKSSGRGV